MMKERFDVIRKALVKTPFHIPQSEEYKQYLRTYGFVFHTSKPLDLNERVEEYKYLVLNPCRREESCSPLLYISERGASTASGSTIIGSCRSSVACSLLFTILRGRSWSTSWHKRMGMLPLYNIAPPK